MMVLALTHSLDLDLVKTFEQMIQARNALRHRCQSCENDRPNSQPPPPPICALGNRMILF